MAVETYPGYASRQFSPLLKAAAGSTSPIRDYLADIPRACKRATPAYRRTYLCHLGCEASPLINRGFALTDAKLIPIKAVA